MAKYIFDPEVVHECSMKCLGQPMPQMFDTFADEMEIHYPGVLDRGQPWLYSIAGGVMIEMKLYYCSNTEYIMIWGTPIGSEGHTGRHRTGFWDTVIQGEMHYYAEGEFYKRIYKPGDRVYVGPGQTCGMNFTDGVFAVEYARGFIPASMPFGLADELLSTLDFKTAAQTLSLYTDLVMQAYGRELSNVPVVGTALSIGAGLVSQVARGITLRLQAPPSLTTMPPDNPRGW